MNDVEQGYWIDLYEEDPFFERAFQCSKCREIFNLEVGNPKENGYNYCPNCGAKMDKKDGTNND